MKQRLRIPICIFAGLCLFCFQSCCVLSRNSIYTLDSAKAATSAEKASPSDGNQQGDVKKSGHRKLPPGVKKVNTDGGYFNTTFIRLGSKNSVRIMQNKQIRAEIFTDTYRNRSLATGFILPLIPLIVPANEENICRIKISAGKDMPLELLSGDFGSDEHIFIKRYSSDTMQDFTADPASIRHKIAEETSIWIEFPLVKNFSLTLLIDGTEYHLIFKQAAIFTVWVPTV